MKLSHDSFITIHAGTPTTVFEAVNENSVIQVETEELISIIIPKLAPFKKIIVQGDGKTALATNPILGYDGATILTNLASEDEAFEITYNNGTYIIRALNVATLINM